jgi:hypothetical protein
LVIHALQAVCRTFESNPIDSAALLRRSFELEHLARYGFEEMPSLAQEVNRLIPLDSALVEDVYKAVFAYRETSAESTPMGQSRILPMRSNRRQDYDMALYGLAEIFPEFLAFTPRRATSALITALEAYIANAHPSASSKEIESFDFDGKVARIQADYSCIWDAHSTYGNDNPIRGMVECKEDEFFVVTGDKTHYLFPEPSVPQCPHHDWGASHAAGVASMDGAGLQRSITPRSFFTSTEMHHCAHRDVAAAKASQITTENRVRCGSRSGEDSQAFCEIWRFETHLCCRTCVFEEVCTKADVFHLPCQPPNLTKKQDRR